MFTFVEFIFYDKYFWKSRELVKFLQTPTFDPSNFYPTPGSDSTNKGSASFVKNNYEKKNSNIWLRVNFSPIWMISVKNSFYLTKARSHLNIFF